jgi:hypothetical protein
MRISSRVAIFIDVLCPKPGARAKGDQRHGYWQSMIPKSGHRFSDKIMLQ